MMEELQACLNRLALNLSMVKTLSCAPAFWNKKESSTLTLSNSPFARFTGARGKQGGFITAEEAHIGKLTGTSITLTRAAPVRTIRQTGEPSVFKGYYRRRAADQMEIRPGRRVS